MPTGVIVTCVPLLGRRLPAAVLTNAMGVSLVKLLIGFTFLAATLLFSSIPETSSAGSASRARGVDVYGSTKKTGCVNGVCPLKGNNKGTAKRTM
jgi:hypothetical protein